MAVMLYIRYPLSLRNVEDLLFERGVDIYYETVRFWWNRFGPLFVAMIINDPRNEGGCATAGLTAVVVFSHPHAGMMTIEVLDGWPQTAPDSGLCH